MSSSTLLEQTRSDHEEIERLERLVGQDLQTEPSSRKDRLVQGHRVRNMIHSIMRTIEKLVCLFPSFLFFSIPLSAYAFLQIRKYAAFFFFFLALLLELQARVFESISVFFSSTGLSLYDWEETAEVGVVNLYTR